MKIVRNATIDVFRNELKKDPSVEAVAASLTIPENNVNIK
jgi:hypothetical protein